MYTHMEWVKIGLHLKVQCVLQPNWSYQPHQFREDKDVMQNLPPPGKFWQSLASGPSFAFITLTWQDEEFLEDSKVWVQVTPGYHWDWPGIPCCQEHLLLAPQSRPPSAECCWLASVCVCVCVFVCMCDSVMSDSLGPPWTIAHQVPLSMEFFRQEYWSG